MHSVNDVCKATSIATIQVRGGSPEHHFGVEVLGFRQEGQSFRSLPDTPHGNSHLLLAQRLTMESLPILAEVVIRGAARVVV